LIFYWLLLRPPVSELQLVSHSFGKFRVALQTMRKWHGGGDFPASVLAWRAGFGAAPKRL